MCQVGECKHVSVKWPTCHFSFIYIIIEILNIYVYINKTNVACGPLYGDILIFSHLAHVPHFANFWVTNKLIMPIKQKYPNLIRVIYTNHGGYTLSIEYFLPYITLYDTLNLMWCHSWWIISNKLFWVQWSLWINSPNGLHSITNTLGAQNDAFH